MISQNVSDILTHKLRRIAQSGLPAHELADTIQKLMEAERAQKLPQDESHKDIIVPIFEGRRAHLCLV